MPQLNVATFFCIFYDAIVMMLQLYHGAWRDLAFVTGEYCLHPCDCDNRLRHYMFGVKSMSLVV